MQDDNLVCYLHLNDCNPREGEVGEDDNMVPCIFKVAAEWFQTDGHNHELSRFGCWLALWVRFLALLAKAANYKMLPRPSLPPIIVYKLINSIGEKDANNGKNFHYFRQ